VPDTAAIGPGLAGGPDIDEAGDVGRKKDKALLALSVGRSQVHCTKANGDALLTAKRCGELVACALSWTSTCFRASL
jgi:hypothetical protein